MKTRTLMIVALIQAGAFAGEIPQGTHALLRLEHAINTRTAEVGDHVYLRTTTPIRVDGGVFIPPGAPVIGKVARVQRGGRLHGRARLEIGLETLLLSTGAAVSISPTITVADKSGTIRRRQDLDPDGAARFAAGVGVFAGLLSGGVAGKLSHNEDIAAEVGFGVGVATGVTTAVLTRNRDLELHPGTTVEMVFEGPVRLD